MKSHRIMLIVSSVCLVCTLAALPAVAVTVDNFNSYTPGAANLPGQGSWVVLDNWYGTPNFPASGVTSNGGIGNSQFGNGDAAVIPINPADVFPNGDVQISVMRFSRDSSGGSSRLLLGNNGLADDTVPLHGNRIFFNGGGDATYQIGESGDTANPGITPTNFEANGWVEILLYVDADDDLGPGVGSVEASWRDVDDSTGAPLGAFTSLGKIPQSYGTPTYFGFNANNAGGDVGIDNLQIGVIPEPTSLTLFGLGMVGLCGVARRRRRNSQ